MGTIFVMFRVMLENRMAIDHLYGTILRRNKDLHARLPSTACWETVKMTHLTMKDTLASIKMNQFKYWFVSDAFHDTVNLYISRFAPCADVQRQVQELEASYVEEEIEIPDWVQELTKVSAEIKAVAKEVLDPMFDGFFCIESCRSWGMLEPIRLVENERKTLSKHRIGCALLFGNSWLTN